MQHKNISDEKAFRLTAKVWQTAFKDMPFDLVYGALQKHVLTNVFPPTIAALRERAVKINNPSALKTAEDAWEEVLTAVKTFGYYQQQKAFETLDEPTRRIIKGIGWSEICHSEKIGIVKSNFCKAYENVTQSQKEVELLPAEVLQRLTDYSKKNLLSNGHD